MQKCIFFAAPESKKVAKLNYEIIFIFFRKNDDDMESNNLKHYYILQKALTQ